MVFNADPDTDADPAFYSMRIQIWIHAAKPMRIDADPDPLPSQKVGF
jgi:hypothetical protein